jgi:hypothetical protein
MAGWKEKSIPPATLADLEADLARPRRSVYVYFGNDTDAGWAAARSAVGRLAWCMTYLVSDREALGARLPDWVGAKRPKGIVFGRGVVPHRLLSKEEAEDSLVVVEAIEAADLATS